MLNKQVLNKQWFAKALIAVTLAVAVAGGSGIVADGLGFEITLTVQVCSGANIGGSC